MSTEQYYAEMEAARNAAEDEYFEARPQLLRTPAEKALFRAGFERAFQQLWCAEDAEFEKALRGYDVPQEPLQVYDSNSYRRVGLAGGHYQVIMYPCTQGDGTPDIQPTPVLRALVAAFNAMLARRAKRDGKT